MVKKGRNLLSLCIVSCPQTITPEVRFTFLMNLHDLALKYNKLMCASIDINILKSKFSIVKQLLGENEDFWRHV